jgi:hypothetical protein
MERLSSSGFLVRHIAPITPKGIHARGVPNTSKKPPRTSLKRKRDPRNCDRNIEASSPEFQI